MIEVCLCFRDENGSWTGLVGALVAGDVDISVAALTMTTEREEVIDYVAPYYDQVPIEYSKNYFHFSIVLPKMFT